MIAFEILFNSLLASVSAALILVIWFDTNAFVEYGRLLGFRFEAYKKNEELGVSFSDWLEVKYDNFITRLIACPICSAVWIQVGGYFIFESIWVLSLGTFFSLIFYFLFKIMMKKADE